MFTNRVFYISLLATVGCFYVLYPFWISWYLFVLLLLLIPFDLIISIPGMLTKRISMTAPKMCEMGESGRLIITTKQYKNYPSGHIKAKIHESNDGYGNKRRIRCSPENGARYTISLDTSHSGLFLYEIKRIHNTSLLGLFSVSHKISCTAAMLVMPVAIKPKNAVSLPQIVVMRPKLAGGFSEETELRDYRSGEPLKSIHWKLSAKYDSLIVREAMEAPPHSRLVYAEQWSSGDERELLLGRLRWVSDYLLDMDMPYCLKIGENGLISEISDTGELIDYLYEVLGNFSSNSMSIISPNTVFSWVFRIDGKQEVSK
ncbi:MAG: DUF58 domain-containing protein [Oscillospiraceae bacterium]|nr:DUF58 domain-containing protein [Oscillospiraceae bacterium]